MCLLVFKQIGIYTIRTKQDTYIFIVSEVPKIQILFYHQILTQITFSLHLTLYWSLSEDWSSRRLFLMDITPDCSSMLKNSKVFIDPVKVKNTILSGACNREDKILILNIPRKLYHFISELSSLFFIMSPNYLPLSLSFTTLTGHNRYKINYYIHKHMFLKSDI